MNEITNNVILDLLPLYLAGEVSEDTAALVKKHFLADSISERLRHPAFYLA